MRGRGAGHCPIFLAPFQTIVKKKEKKGVYFLQNTSNLNFKLFYVVYIYSILYSRVAEVAREHRWHLQKSLDTDENFKPEHTLFCRKLRFVAIYALFGDLWAKKVPFWVKNSVSWARSALLHGIYCIFHWVNFANLRLRAKTTHLMRKL